MIKKQIKTLNELNGLENEYFILKYEGGVIKLYSKYIEKDILIADDIKELYPFGFDISMLKKLNNISLLSEILNEHNLTLIMKNNNMIILNKYNEIVSINSILKQYGYYL